MSKKMTAVDFIIETLAKNGILHSSDIEKAKAMEKEQIKSSFNKGYSNGYSNGLMYIEGEDFHTFANSDANISYNETYKSE